ncbi:MAG: site-specific integrase [Leptospirales bacterium]
MATFRRRGDFWQASIRRKGLPAQHKTFDTKEGAIRWARELESAIDRGVYHPQKEAERTTLAEALERYEREVIPAKKGAKQELVRIRRWKQSLLAPRFLASIQGKDIAAYRDERLKAAAPNTVRHELAVLSHVFTIALKEWGLTGLVNPVRQIRVPKMPPGRDRRLLPGELDRVLSASESAVLANIVLFALETGMRQAEITGMTWNLIDAKKKTLVLPDTKNGEKRVVPLSNAALKILSGMVPRIDGKVWGITSHAIAVAWRRAVSRARKSYESECTEKGKKPEPDFLVGLTFHDLRHEATSRFFEKGLNPMQVAAITGHKTLQMLKRYTHLKAEDLAELLK